MSRVFNLPLLNSQQKAEPETRACVWILNLAPRNGHRTLECEIVKEGSPSTMLAKLPTVDGKTQSCTPVVSLKSTRLSVSNIKFNMPCGMFSSLCVSTQKCRRTLGRRQDAVLCGVQEQLEQR